MNIRVRIAPSPTGLPHIGLARTALFNFLFARSHGGTFIVRIEDTDNQRSKKEYEEEILNSFKWLELHHDEIYRSSERVHEHQQAVESLLRTKQAYRCFCTPEQLREARMRAEQQKQPFRYEGTCYNLSTSEQEEKIQKGEPFVVRLRVINTTPITFKDLIRGDVTFPISTVDDFVISKGVTHPLYHLAVVVDDAAMNITHVIRGEEHISNTPKHILLQHALKVPTPRYAHIPLILDESGKKLSKRSSSTETLITAFRDNGYLPEALINALALVGWNPKTEQELFSMDELIHTFRIQDVQKGGATFSLKRLENINRQHIKKLTPEEILLRIKPYINQDQFDDIFKEQILRGITVEQDRAVRLTDFPEMLSFIFSQPELLKKHIPWKDSSLKETKEVLMHAIATVQNFPEERWEDREKLEQEFLKLADESKKGRGTVLWPVRYVLCGQQQSPGPHELAWVLGKKETVARLKQAASMV